MLTLQEKNAFDFIKQFIDEKGHAPTIMEIAHALGIKSRGVAHRYVSSLSQKGFLKTIPNRRRNIALIEQHKKHYSLPIIGQIAAGRPIEAIAQFETFDMEDIFLREGHFALRVRGDSMIDEGIFDGDIVICKNVAQPSNGQIVVALIDNHEVTLKRIEFKPDKTITLHPANDKLQPINYAAHRVSVQGGLVGLIRLP